MLLLLLFDDWLLRNNPPTSPNIASFNPSHPKLRTAEDLTVAATAGLAPVPAGRTAPPCWDLPRQQHLAVLKTSQISHGFDLKNGDFPLVICQQFANLNSWPIDIVDLRMNSMVIFQFANCKRLPEGTYDKLWALTSKMIKIRCQCAKQRTKLLMFSTKLTKLTKPAMLGSFKSLKKRLEVSKHQAHQATRNPLPSRCPRLVFPAAKEKDPPVLP